MRARTPFVIFFLLVLLALVQAGGRSLDSRAKERVVLAAPGGALTVELADSDSERIRGLSGQKKLGADEWMLFIFPRAEYHGIWMKDMMFPLDLVWLDEWKPQTDADSPGQISGRNLNGQAQTDAERGITLVVVDIKEHVAPETFPKVFYPREQARYVLEVNAGVARETGIRVGEKLMFAR